MSTIKAATISNYGKATPKNTDSFLSGGFVPDRFTLETAGHHSIEHFVMTAAKQTSCFAVFSGHGEPESSAEAARKAADALKKEMVRLAQLPLSSAESLIQRFAGQIGEQLAKMPAPNQVQPAPGMSFACVCLRGNEAVAFNSGNARVYLFRLGEIRQVSSDQGTDISTCHSSGLIRLRNHDRFLIGSEMLLQDADPELVSSSLRLDDLQQAAHQLLSASLEHHEQASITLTVVDFSDSAESYPEHVLPAAGTAGTHQQHPHIEHQRQVMNAAELKPEKPAVSLPGRRVSFWAVIPAWLRIVLVIFLILAIIFLGWIFGSQLTG